jgi:hypothetical protein
MKVPLKIKIFMWFLHRREILTKDNLVKRNWQGSECPLAKIVWRIIYMTFSLSPPANVTNLFGIG